MKRLVWLAAGVGLALAALDVFPARFVLAPLLGLAILRVGLASFGSLRQGASFVPDGPPRPVDQATERVVYWCAGCGAELLLLVRGSQAAPRHCGERMSIRREVTGDRPFPQLGTSVWRE